MSIRITVEDIAPCLIGNTVMATLTNYGYLLYTLNMLKSLEPFGLDKTMFIVTMDEKSCRTLTKRGYHAISVDSAVGLDKFFQWNTKGYDKICYYKLELIYRILSLQKNIVLVDGDIVFQSNPIHSINEWNALDHDVWIQNDGVTDEDTTNMCTGYMMIRTNEKLIQLYDCISNTDKYATCVFDNNDQTYFNRYVKSSCTMLALPLLLYPNGNIFYNMPDIKTNCVLVHFNWVKGHLKMAKMKEHQMWLLTPEEEYI